MIMNILEEINEKEHAHQNTKSTQGINDQSNKEINYYSTS